MSLNINEKRFYSLQQYTIRRKLIVKTFVSKNYSLNKYHTKTIGHRMIKVQLKNKKIGRKKLDNISIMK